MKILALDVATKTGWATETASGVWDLTPKRDQSAGMKLIILKSFLKEIVAMEGIDVIAFEMSSGRFKSAIIHQSELHGVVKLFCEEHKIDYCSYPPTKIKVFATGKGGSNKAAMVAAAKEKYGVKIIDDNHADALHLYHYAMSQLN